MSLQQNLLAFMQDAERRDSGRTISYSNAVGGQMVAGLTINGRNASGELSFSQTVTELSGAPEEDFFLYTRSGVTLARNERAMYNVFSGSVGYEHIYEWDVQDQP